MMTSEQSPWICHVCDRRSTGESTVCSVCYRTTCQAHLKRAVTRNGQSGLFEINWQCVCCVMEEAAR